MATHRAPEELKERILQGTMRLVAAGGMSNFSFPKLSAETGISAPTVYEYFKNKEDLLSSCFMKIDTEVSSLVAKILQTIPAHVNEPEKINDYCWLLWNVYWRFLLADADRTLFYWSFYNSEYYNARVLEKRLHNFEAFLGFVDQVDLRFSISEKQNAQLLVANMLDNTVSTAVKVLRGQYPNDASTVNTVYRMVFYPILSFFGFATEPNSAPPSLPQ